MRRAAIGLVLGSMVLWSVPSTALAAKKPAFPDGTWSGTALHTGHVSAKGVAAWGDAAIVFDLTVEGGEVTDGKMTVVGGGVGTTTGTAATLDISGTFSLSGSAAVVKATGTYHFEGTASSYGVEVPLEFSMDTSGTFSPSWVSCNKVTGDLATTSQEAAEAAGFDASLSANFVAVREGGTPAAASITKEYGELVDAVLDATDSAPPVSLVLQLAQQVDALNAKVAGLGACDTPPKGFEKGLSDTVLASLFQDLLQTVLNDPDAYTAQQLLSLLAVGVHVGAVGPSVGGSAAFRQMADSLYTQFGANLEVKLEAAAKAGDTATILDILVGAQQFGFDSLADKAQGYLASVSPGP